MTPSLTLKHGREKSVRSRHPWVFAGALEAKDDAIHPGATVDLYADTGEWLARGAYNRQSQIAVRIWTWKKDQAVDETYFRTRLAHCSQRREELRKRTDAFRIVNAENDGLPGLIIDQYGSFLIVQFLSAGSEYWRQEILHVICGWSGILGVYDRSDSDVREKEGLEKTTGLLWGEEPPDEIIIREEELSFCVDVRKGHKTGFYLDQRDNRARLKNILTDMNPDLRLLNAFCFSGAFSVVGKKYGRTRVVQVDSSDTALEMAKRNYEINALSTDGDEFLEQDVFQALRTFRDANQKFDLVILDPPKFAFSKQDLMRAARAYKDINWLAMRLLNPGGFLFTFSCSGLVSETLFQQIVFSAAMDAGRNVSIVGRMHQASDHPVRLTFPEGAYLKGLILRSD
jgi:23S rRNA (cytosine1962-C5)-methyltransferase